MRRSLQTTFASLLFGSLLGCGPDSGGEVADGGRGETNRDPDSSVDGGAGPSRGDGDAGDGDASGDGDADSGRPPPTLDPTFGAGGTLTTPQRDASEDLVDVARQADGKLVAIGTNWAHSDVVLYRFHADGTPDLSFNRVGSVIVALGLESRALAVAIQPDGRIVALMREYAGFSGPFRVVVTRFESDGSLDFTWGTAGRVQLAGDAGAFVVQPDGKVLVAAGGSVTRLTTTGQLDESFGNGGASPAWTAQPITPVQFGIALDSHGRIFVASFVSGQFAGIACLTSAGAFDTSFDGDGTLETGLSAFSVAFTVGPDDKPLLASALKASPVLARYGTDGALDLSFSGDGYAAVSGSTQDLVVSGTGDDARIVLLHGSTSSDDSLEQFTLAGEADAAFDSDGIAWPGTRNSLGLLVGDGRFVLAGYELTRPPGYSDSFRIPRLERITLAGALDTSWGNGGKVLGHAQASLDEAHALARAADGSVFVAGRSNIGGNWQACYALAKYDATGTLIASFGVQGIAYLDQDDSGIVARGVAIDRSENVVVAGGSNGQLARFTSTGKLDGSFGTNGLAQLNGGYGYALALDAQARPVIGGVGTESGKRVGFIARGTAAGKLDSSFGTNGYTFSDPSPSPTKISAVLALALDSDGNVLVTGSGAVGLLTRYDADGQPDPSFQATDGTMGVGRAIDIASDGRVLVAGTDTVNGWDYALDDYTASSKVLVARFLSSGAPDPTFATGGFFSASLPGSGLSGAFTTSVRATPQGDVYVGGMTLVAGVLRGFVLHLLDDGTPDVQFGTSGVLLAPLAGESSGLFALAHDGNNALIAAGFAYSNPSGRDFALIRLTR